jgi:hypothetical protein
MAERRGKKTNHNKNFVAAKDFAAGKRVGRKKQIWVWDVLPESPVGVTAAIKAGLGHWEKI